MAKYNNLMYKTGSSYGGSNKNFKLITCEDKFMLCQYSKAMYKIKFIHIYFLPRLDGTEMIIHKYFSLVQHQKRRPEWK